MMPMTWARRRTSSGRKSRMPRAGSVRAILRDVLQPRQGQALLALILALLVRVRHLAGFVALEEEHLRDPFVRVDLGGKRRRVRNLEGHVAFPLGLERRDVDDEAAARVGRLAHA